MRSEVLRLKAIRKSHAAIFGISAISRLFIIFWTNDGKFAL
jgi:hypothetical protein